MSENNQQNSDKIFEKIFYINLDRRPDRDNNVKNIMNELNLSANRISAVDGTKLDLDSIPNDIITPKGIADANNNNQKVYVLENNPTAEVMAKHFYHLFKNNIPQLKFKNLQIFNICNKKTSNEIHINKILYNERKILNKTDIAELRLALQTQLKKIQQLTFEQIHVINDEFSERISPNYLTELL